MRRKIRCDGESKFFCKFFWELTRPQKMDSTPSLQWLSTPSKTYLNSQFLITASYTQVAFTK